MLGEEISEGKVKEERNTEITENGQQRELKAGKLKGYVKGHRVSDYIKEGEKQ